MQRLKCHPARWGHPIPDKLTYVQGALLEPLSVVLRALELFRISLGSPVLIHGAGPIGLITLAAARASGAHPLVITHLEPRRLDFARRFVPGCQTYLTQRNLDAQGNANGIRAVFGVGVRDQKTGSSKNETAAPSTVLECTGVESSIVTAAYACRRAGTLVIVGVGKSVMNNFPFMHLSLAEVIVTSFPIAPSRSQFRTLTPFLVYSCASYYTCQKPTLTGHVFLTRSNSDS
ncbi:hypothetical protein LTR84_006979 [Exophiala bonariae]|uniref:Alcohol dehydrogenase-like C-terminal domain-containing protein n=1 Tax=Exophiala bonariae TaxID=1690606 RepID=A0AAV9N1H5_9EURO|nr:hypothetical protein LTR84_006979 [Exophiala bonariae]